MLKSNRFRDQEFRLAQLREENRRFARALATWARVHAKLEEELGIVDPLDFVAVEREEEVAS